MELEVLISTMNQKDYSLLKRMNIQTKATVINQTNEFGYTEKMYNKCKINWYNFSERGIGLSRNSALMRSSSDICLFADDDVAYVDGYEEIIISAFEKNPKADIIVFNVPSLNHNRPTYIIKKASRVRWFNSLRYGAVKIAIRRERIQKKNVNFSLLFGGGAKYGSGEDSLFLFDCLRNGLKIYAVPDIIGYVSQEESSWFGGYNYKYFYDKGAFFGILSRRAAKVLSFQFVFRHRKQFNNEINWIEAYKIMIRGIKDIDF